LDQVVAGGRIQHKNTLLKFLEHAGLGAAVELGISQAAGGSSKYGAGVLSAGVVAGFKEGSDAIAGRDILLLLTGCRHKHPACCSSKTCLIQHHH
jgi:hypothetical protein